MRKYSRQWVDVGGVRRLVDVPVDSELYKADNHNEYQRARGKAKHVTLTDEVFAGFTVDVADAYEETQLLDSLRKALQSLTDNERQLIEYIYYDGLTEKEVAAILMVAQQTVNKKKHKVIGKLRENMIDWM